MSLYLMSRTNFIYGHGRLKLPTTFRSASIAKISPERCFSLDTGSKLRIGSGIQRELCTSFVFKLLHLKI